MKLQLKFSTLLLLVATTFSLGSESILNFSTLTSGKPSTKENKSVSEDTRNTVPNTYEENSVNTPEVFSRETDSITSNQTSEQEAMQNNEQDVPENNSTTAIVPDNLISEQETTQNKTQIETYQDQQTENLQSYESSENEKKFFKGIGVSFGGFNELLEEEAFNSSESFDFSISFLLRKYFYKNGSLQAGLGLSYHSFSGKYENFIFQYYDIDFWNISFEAPLSAKLGLPFIKFSPYFTATTTIRKPIFHRTSLCTHCDKESKIYDFYGPGDFEFLLWIGVGMEFTHYFSIDFSWLMGSGCSGTAHDYDTEESWRVNISTTW